MCLAKGLTGGMLPLAATLTTEAMFESFLHVERSRFFPHGHTFTANPIACAVACTSLSLCRDHDVPARLAAIGRRLHEQIADLASHPRVRDLRQLGGMCAFDIAGEPGQQGYLSQLAPHLRQAAVQRGVLLRPLGNVLYALPPACVDDDQVDRIAEVMRELVETLP
jgi:adenosylmethionine-8-amino-7-oxononanoate aminotransferase